MCGIAGGLGLTAAVGPKACATLAHRGPDASGTVFTDGILLAHTRLSIIDPDPRSDQPFITDAGIELVYNGELWNYEAIRSDLQAEGFQFRTDSDTEVVAQALGVWGVDALPMFEGMFAMAWIDVRGDLYAARDRFGEVPLHLCNAPVAFASELKALNVFAPRQASYWLTPGSYAIAGPDGWVIEPYYSIPSEQVAPDVDVAIREFGQRLEYGVTERRIADVPVCTLLSGGIDSSIIAAMLVPHFPDLVAYTAVYDPQSRDLRAARSVAEQLDITLVEVPIPLPSPDDLAQTVRIIEAPYKAQVEIGWPCFKLAQAIASDGFKVTYSGEGSDELWGSYGFAYHGIQAKGWHAYRRELFTGQHRKNFARCNKVFMSEGIECRLPFLNTAVVEYALSLDRDTIEINGTPKGLLREASRGWLTDDICQRSKIAFQDGLGIKTEIPIHKPASFYKQEFRREYGNHGY